MALQKNIQATEKLLKIIRKTKKAPPPLTPKKIPTGKAAKKQIRIGVEVNDYSVRFTATSLNSHGRLLGYMQANLSATSPDKLMEDELLPLLKKFCAPFPKYELWFLMNSPNMEILHYDIPQIGAKQVDSAAFWAAQKEKKIDTTTHLFDYHILGEKTDNGVKKYRIMAYSLPREEVDEWKHFFRRIGYPLKGITSSPFCLQNMFQTKWLNAPEEASSAHVFIEDDWSQINIFHQELLAFNREVKTGLNSVLTEIQDVYEPSGQKEDIQPPSLTLEEKNPETAPEGTRPKRRTSSVKISVEQASAILMSQIPDGPPLSPGQPGAELSPEQILDYVRPAMDRLLRQIQRTLSHYNNTMNLAPVEKIFISGTMSLYPPLLRYLEEELGLEIEVLDPFQDGRHQSHKLLSPQSMEQRDLFLSSIGLALSSLVRTPNFLFTYKEKNNEKKLILIKRAVLAASAFLLLLAFSLNFAAMVYLNKKESALSSLNKKYVNLQHEQAAIEEQIRATDPGINLSSIREVQEKIQALNRYLEVNAVRYAPVAFLSEFFSLTPEGIAVHKVLYSNSTNPLTLTYNSYNNYGQKEKLKKFGSPFGFFDIKEQSQKTRDNFSNSKFLLVDGIVTANKQDQNLTLAVYKMLLNDSPFFEVMDVEKNSQITPGIGNALHFTLALKVTL